MLRPHLLRSEWEVQWKKTGGDEAILENVSGKDRKDQST
jgi:hypothetical protein